MYHWLNFISGFAGSAAMEVVTLYRFYQRDTRRKPVLPHRYRARGFWVTRSLLAVAAGGLALLYNQQAPLLSVGIGVAAPFILERLGELAVDQNPTPKRSRRKSKPD